MSARSPYALHAWYPAVRAAARAYRVLGEDAAPGRRAVESAWAEVAPGGALVIVDRPRSRIGRFLRLGRRARARGLAQGLAGASRIDRWLALPGTGGSGVLLPTSRDGFTAGARLLPAGRRRWRLARRLLTALAWAGLAERLGFDVLLVAVRGAAGGPRVPWVAECADSDATVALGVPGAFRKAVVLVSGRRGTVRGLLKLPVTSASRENVRREADALERLAELPGDAAPAPALLARAEAGDVPWLVQAFVDGRRSPEALGAAHFAFLADLRRRTAVERDLEDLGVFRSACARLDALRDGTEREWHAALAALRDAVRRWFAEAPVPCCMAHGDFTPWNLLLVSGRLVAFDWELAEEEAPALFDLIHFHFQTGILVRHLAAPALLEELDAVVAGAGRPLLRSFGLRPAAVDALAGLHVLHAATLDEAANRVERPPFAQVDWLRSARLELARRLVRRLAGGAREPVSGLEAAA